LTKRNIRGIKEFIEFCKKLGAKRIRFVQLIILENKKELKKEQISKEKLGEFKNKIKNIKNIEITFACRTCEAGKNYLTIQANGDITPCSLNQRTILGNIKRKSIKEILEKARNLNFKSCMG